MRSGNVFAKAMVVFTMAFVALAPTPALGHSEVPGFRNLLDGVTPPVPGVRIEVVTSAAAQLVAENSTLTPLEIVADGGEGFLRISAAGVEANLASPDWYRSATPEGDGRVPSAAVAGAAPIWARVSSASSWGWFDHRLHASRVDRAPPTAGADGTVRLGGWTVLARYGTETITITGRREFVRPTGRFRAELQNQVDGLRSGVVDGTVPAISVVAPAGRSLVVLGEAGEPMVRLGPAGPEGNLASPTWQLTAASKGAPPDGPVGADLEPRWQSLGGGTTLTWLEPRARYAEALPPTSVLDAGRAEVVMRWSVPVELDGVKTMLTGTTSWVPQAVESADVESAEDTIPSVGPARNRTPIALALGVGATALTAVVLLAGRRRSRRS